MLTDYLEKMFIEEIDKLMMFIKLFLYVNFYNFYTLTINVTIFVYIFNLSKRNVYFFK